MLTIYALVDPRDGLEPAAAVRYVGATSMTIAARLSGHVSSAKHASGPPVRGWLRELTSLGTRPILSPLERTKDRDAEGEWIAFLRSLGCPLLNKADPPRPRKFIFDTADEERYRRELGARLAGLFGDRGMTAEDVAAMAGISLPMVDDPKAITLLRLAQELGVSPGWLAFGG